MPPAMKLHQVLVGIALWCAAVCVQVATADRIIGIDLGTTFSVVGVWNNTSAMVDILPDSDGKRITPSYVHFDEYGHVKVGYPAKDNFAANPDSTIYGIKRVLGRDFDDIKAHLGDYQYQIVESNGKPYVSVHGQQYPPETISGAVLSKMKSIAQEYLNTGVTKAVVTVPAYFQESQRRATMIAGKVAGLEIVRIINEPTAAAIAYGLDKTEESVVLVYDLGGGTFDVSLLTLDEGIFQVSATNGDNNLGGEDFDQNVVNFWMQEDTSLSKADIPELKKLAEQAKINLSTTDKTSVSMSNGKKLSLTRDTFESVNLAAFERTLVPVQKVLEDAGVSTSEVNEIVLVGGSTRIPKIQQMLSEHFGGRDLNKEINPDEAVAYGAAVQARILESEYGGDSSGPGIVLLDVTPLTLGIEILGGYMAKIVDRNTPVPVEQKQRFTSVVNNQKEVKINVYEGERPLTKDNHLLDNFSLQNLPPGPKGSAQIDVTFQIDVNGMLHVTAHDLKGNNIKGIQIDSQKHRLSQADIERITQEAERYMIHDKHQILKMRLVQVEKDHPDDIDLADLVDEILDWCIRHEDEDPKDMERKLNDYLGVDTDSSTSRKDEL